MKQKKWNKFIEFAFNDDKKFCYKLKFFVKNKQTIQERTQWFALTNRVRIKCAVLLVMVIGLSGVQFGL